MFEDTDNSLEAQKWRRDQRLANEFLAAIIADPELRAEIDQWDTKGLSQDERATRLKEMLNSEDDTP